MLTQQRWSGSRLKVVRWSEVEESELRAPVLQKRYDGCAQAVQSARGHLCAGDEGYSSGSGDATKG